MRKERQQVVLQGGAVLDGEIQAPAGSSAGGGAVTANAAGGVTALFDRMRAVRHVRLVLADVSIAVLAANDYGGVKLCDIADTNIMLLAIEANLELVKGLTENGIVGTTDVTVAVGTAVASNATLSGAMVNVLTGIALTATDETPAYQIHSQADATLNYPIELADAATLALYLNVAASITANDTITASGTVDLYFVDIGNTTS